MKLLVPVVALLLALTLHSCASESDDGAQTSHVAPVVDHGASELAYDVATRVQLPDVAPTNTDSLHQLFRLSHNIFSGAEPDQPGALQAIAGLGVKTILSVDGKAPNHEAAVAAGLRYVHVPIRYKGITEEEKLAIAKTFREMPGPFYVHCFHGKHRGPAAAALGRVVLDGASRERAVAEMRQWCGTSSKYEGLYQSIAYEDLPTAEDTADHDFDFAPAFQFEGLRGAMIEISRSFEGIEGSAKVDWKPNPNHPDLVPLNEARRIFQAYQQTLQHEDLTSTPSDLQEAMKRAAEQSAEMIRLLELKGQGNAGAADQAKALVASMKSSCGACHKAYRNR